MSRRIAIVDTGSGNLRSVAKAIEEVGGVATITADAGTIRGADRVVVMQEGRIVEVGQRQDLLSGDGLFSRLVAAEGEPAPTTA